ncbi:MAG: hypothetical protein AAF196_19285 [Planctomycetota bacterium]
MSSTLLIRKTDRNDIDMKRLLIALSTAAALAGPAASQVSLDFEGGTLTQYVAELRTAIDAQRELYSADPPPQIEIPNVLLKGDSDAVELPPIRLVSVSSDAALNILEVYVNDERRRVNVEKVSNGREAHGGRGLVVIEVRESKRGGSSRQAQEPEAPPSFVEVFSVRQLTTTPLLFRGEDFAAELALPIESLIVAIDTGTAMIENPDSVQVRYHEDSGLLFVRGEPGHIQLVSQVIQRSTTMIQERRNEAHQLLNARRMRDRGPSESGEGR